MFKRFHGDNEIKSCLFNPKTAGGEGEGSHLKPRFFETFNIVIKHIFPEDFIEILQVVRKI